MKQYKILSLLLVLPNLTWAATIPGNTLIDFEAASDGSIVTSTIMTGSTEGQLWNGWRTVQGTTPYLTIESSAQHPLFTPADINGTIYTGTGTRGLRANMAADNAVHLTLPSPGFQLSVGFYFRYNGPQINWAPRDVVGLRSDPSGNYQFLQIYDGPTPSFNAHWQPGGTGVGNKVNFNRNQWYWVTMRHVAGGDTMRISFYDPSQNYSLVGTSSGFVSSGTRGCTAIQIGCIKYSSGGSQSVDFDNFIINTNGVFPLGPGGGGTFNQQPQVFVAATPRTGVAPLTVNFSSTGSSDPEGTPLTYNWAFGDGTTSTLANPSHTYQAVSNYLARLTISDGTNSVTSTNLSIRVSATPINDPPVVAASATPRSGAAPLAVAFSSAGTSDPEGTPLSYNWTFGDGTISTAANPNHTYASIGNYTARLTVSDGTNSVLSSAIGVTVVAAGSGLVASYSFDEGSGQTVFDASGNNNSGSIIGARWMSNGRHGGALAFDGASRVAVNDSASLDLRDQMTLEAWVYPTNSLTSWRTIVIKERSGGFGYAIYAGSPAGRPNGLLYISSADEGVYGPSTLPQNAWSHLAATYDGSVFRLYVNGNEVANSPVSGEIIQSGSGLNIGGNTVWNDEFFQGMIDEVRIYNRALSVPEIRDDMNAPIGFERPSPPNNFRVVVQ